MVKDEILFSIDDGRGDEAAQPSSTQPAAYQNGYNYTWLTGIDFFFWTVSLRSDTHA